MLRIVRELAQDIACRTLIFAPALTASVAISLLKVGLCQELSQRFALEYFIKYNRKDISLIFLSNPNEGPKLEDHMFVHIGPINVPETLLLGKNTNLRYCQLSPKKANQEFAEFLSNNKNGICADPLLHCAGNVDGGLAPLLEYCERHNLTHVICVSSYHNTPGIVENAPTIKNNAIAVAEKIKSQLGIAETLVRGLQKKPQK